MLLVSETGSRETLKDVVANYGEGVVRVVDLVCLEIKLTADTKMSQAQLVDFGTFLALGSFVE